MITIHVTTTGMSAIRRMLAAGHDLPRRLAAPIGRGIYQGALEVLGRAIKTRFTGKGPFPPAQHKLGRVTGKLAQSLRVARPVVEQDGSVSVAMGSNLKYFAIHEFGGRFNVRAHSRRVVAARFNTRGRLTRATINRRLENAGRSNVQQVRAHKRTVPARRPLGTALDENASRYQISLAVSRAIRQSWRNELSLGRQIDSLSNPA